MNKGLIITLPKHDTVTEYLSQFSQEIIKEADMRGLSVRKLSHNEATKKAFEQSVAKLDYRMVIFNGHGSDDAIGGHNDDAIVSKGVNDNTLKDRITYARSCNAASELGAHVATYGGETCFIGYELLFQFYVDTQWELNPLKDNTARLYLGPSNMIAISLIKGNTTREAHENSKKHLLKNIKKVLRKKDKESYLLAEALWNNYLGKVILGDKETRL